MRTASARRALFYLLAALAAAAAAVAFGRGIGFALFFLAALGFELRFWVEVVRGLKGEAPR